MPFAEMRNSPQASCLHTSPKAGTRAPEPVPALFSSAWTRAGVWCLAVISLGASLAYLRTDERPPATAYALDRDWATTSALGVTPGAGMAPAAPLPVCAICGQVEAVKPLPFSERLAGRKPLFRVTVRMEDGRTLAVQVEKPPTVGTQVTLERGVLRLAHA